MLSNGNPSYYFFFFMSKKEEPMARNDSDYIGFTYNGVRSTDLGILRISNGSRYTESLFPTSSDKIAIAPGANETYYWGSQDTQKTFSIEFAFDNLKEHQLKNLKALMGDKHLYPIVFDERPYMEYYVKSTGNSTLSYVPFYEKNNRVYKGEGTLQLVSYFPYGRLRRTSDGTPMNLLSQYNSETMPQWKFEQVTYKNFIPNQIYFVKEGNIYKPITTVDMYDEAVESFDFMTGKFGNFYHGGNINEWYVASGLNNLENYTDKEGNKITFNTLVEEKNYIYVYNPGDMPSPFNLTFIPEGTCEITLQGKKDYATDAQLQFVIEKLKPGDAKIRVNTKLNLIEGLDSSNLTTGNIYNEGIRGGQFFHVPVTTDFSKVNVIGFTHRGTVKDVKIDYVYLYR